MENCGLPLAVAGTANSGFAALDLLEREPVDVVLSDIRMPIMSGIEFARKAKALQPEVKIVFISGHEDFGYAKEAIHINASGYLLKPVDDDELYRMLEKLCAELEAERAQRHTMSEALTIAAQEMLLRWLNRGGQDPADERLRELLTPLAQGGTAAAVLEIDDLEWKTRDMAESDRLRLVEDMTRYIASAAAESGLGMAIASAASPRVVLDRKSVV